MDYSVGGVYLLGEVTFLPKAGYSGVVTIPYVGTDADGIEYTGTVQVMVTPSASSRFSDMGSYNSWAGASVEFLAAYGITTGTGRRRHLQPRLHPHPRRLYPDALPHLWLQQHRRRRQLY